MIRLWTAVWLLNLGVVALAEDIRLATYNIENFQSHFSGFHLGKRAATQPADEAMKELIEEEKRQNDEDNWEVSLVLRDKEVSPDILVIQECCGQSDLEFFNRRWLEGAYRTVIVFPGNSERNQNLGMMLKDGYEVVERKDQYYLEKDSVPNERGDRLFARGPAFVLVRAPGGYRFWVGVTHQKSKTDNSLEATQWRNREAARTRQIVRELEKDERGNGDVILLGDMNDEVGVQEFEKEAGDTIEQLVGPADEGLNLATGELAKAGEISFGGYWRTRHRGLIDHVVTTRAMKEQVGPVRVFKGSVAAVASDHYPVVVQLRSEPAPATAPSTTRVAE